MTLMSKIGQPMLREFHFIWVKLLNAKYASSQQLLGIFQAKMNLSSCWKGMTKSAHIISKGMQWEVGNG